MQFPDNITRLCGGKRFSFECHPGVPCFTECCRELDLVLTPYDVLRLCRELRMKPKDLIDRYVVEELDEKGAFPVLYLGMVDDGRASCPFVSPEGCRVYNGRPGACRAYPVGRGTSLDENGRKRELFVLVREDHCCGFIEEEVHTAAEWFRDQGLDEYNRMNDEVLTLLQHEKVKKGLHLSEGQRENFLLALYRLDEFRVLVSSEGFLDDFVQDTAERDAVLTDDVSLLHFGIRWLKETLFADKA
jgi:Fe-S-cluster containining protein